MSATAGGDDEEYAEWELVWAKAAAKGDWWPCQKCEVPDSRYPNDLTKQIKLDDGEHCVYCFGSLNYAKIKPGMIAKFHKNYEQFSKECKKKSFLKAMEEVERFRVGTFPGAPRPRQPDAKKPAAKKDEKERPKKKQKVEQKRSESDTSSSSSDDDDSDGSSSDDSNSSQDEKSNRKPKVSKASGGMPAKKAAKDKEPPADLPKKPPSAFSRFCTDHRDRFKDKYGELGMVERKEKMGEVWTTMQGSEERKRYEKAFENEMEEWKKACEEVGSKGKKAAGGGKGEEPCNVKAGGKADGVDRGKADGKTSKHDMERKSLLQKLTALGHTLSTAVEDLTKIHKSQSRILSNFAQRPLPEDAEEKTKFLFNLKTSQVGKAVVRMKKSGNKEVSEAATALRGKWEALLSQASGSQQVEGSAAETGDKADETAQHKSESAPTHPESVRVEECENAGGSVKQEKDECSGAVKQEKDECSGAGTVNEDQVEGRGKCNGAVEAKGERDDAPGEGKETGGIDEAQAEHKVDGACAEKGSEGDDKAQVQSGGGGEDTEMRDSIGAAQ